MSAASAALRAHRVFVGVVAVHCTAAILLWLSGSPAGSWPFECGVGTIADELANGTHPWVSPQDLYDRWTSGYLLAGALLAPAYWLFGPSIVAMKGLSLLFTVATLGLGYAFLHRFVSPLAARIGVLLLGAAPPLLWFYAVHAGDYHYTELAFDLALMWAFAEVVLSRRRGLLAWLGLGLVAGLAVTNCFGSLPYVAAMLAMTVCIARSSLLSTRALLLLLGGIVGAAPLLHKLFLHHAFGVGQPYAAKLFGGKPSGAGGRPLIDRLVEFPSVYPTHLGFTDGLSFLDLGAAQAVGDAYAALTLAAFALTPFLLTGAVRAGVSALLPKALPDGHGRRLAPLLPALFVLAFLLAYAVGGLEMSTGPWVLQQMRSDRFLPPLVGLLAMSTAVVAATAIERWPRLRRPLLTLVASVSVVSVVSWGGLVDWGGLAAPSLGFRATCHDLVGFYSAAFLPERDALAGGWEDRGLCDGFGGDARMECYRGRIWGIGMRHVQPGQIAFSPPEQFAFDPRIAALCGIDFGPWRDDCFRQTGWALLEPVRRARWGPAASVLPRYCARLPEERDRQACVEGFGFWAADHYAYAPWKIDWVAPRATFGGLGRRAVGRGAGAFLAHLYADRRPAERVCARYGAVDPALGEACREGLDAGYALYAEPPPAPPSFGG